MPLIKVNSALFDKIEAASDFPEINLDHQFALDTMTAGDMAGDPTVLQLSSNLIRIQQNIWAWDDAPVIIPYELRISGAGLTPVSSMNALIEAINNGLALGTLSKFAILADGVEVLSLTLSTAGYVLASGAQSVTLSGGLPRRFTQFYDMADLFQQVANIDFLTTAERQALFADLAAYSVSGLTFKDGGTTLFSVQVSATSASLSINGLTLTLTGTFPDNLGEDISLLWEAFASFRMTGDAAALAAFTQDDLSVSSLLVTNAAGKVLVSVTDPLADTPLTYELDGKPFDDLQIGNMSADWMGGGAGNSRDALAGLGGNDRLEGLRGVDRLDGGSGKDTLDGGKSNDLLIGGKDRDVLTGGADRDVFQFRLGDGNDRITDFTVGEDVIRITDANRVGNLDFVRIGQDVQINFGSIQILIEDISLAELRQIDNFQF